MNSVQVQKCSVRSSVHIQIHLVRFASDSNTFVLLTLGSLLSESELRSDSDKRERSVRRTKVLESEAKRTK